MNDVATTDTRKRILFVENGIGYGGAVICLRHLARNLDREAFIGRIVTGRTGPEYQTIPADAEWRHIRDRHVDVVGWRRRLDASAGIKAVPGLHAVLNQVLARLDDVANFLPFFLGLGREIRAFRPDLIHANNDPFCNRAAVLLGKCLKIPTVCHVRGPLTGSRLMAPLFRLPDHFLPVSHWIDREIEKLGIPAARRSVIYDGIELGTLAARGDGQAFRQGFGIGEQDFAVGLVGLLIPWKGQRLFLESARRLRASIPRLKMLIVGGTPEECQAYAEALRREVAEGDLADTVMFTGHMDDMSSVYKGLDIVVSASINPEPLGTVVIESMALGRPLIAPNHGGGAEMNRHGETALLFEPGNAESLGAAILAIHESPELGARLGAAARERASRAFDVARHVAQVQEIYRRLLE